MKRYLTILTIFIFVSSLYGCGRESELIEMVKKRPINEMLTYGQAFESSSYCTNSKWSVEKDEKNRDVVVHTCIIKISKNHIIDHVNKRAISVDQAISLAKSSSLSHKIFDIKYLLRDARSRQQEQDLNPERTPFNYELLELKRKFNIDSINDGELLLAKLEAELTQDIYAIPDLVELYKKDILSSRPSSLKVMRITKVILLPNERDQWTTPEFFVPSMDISFVSPIHSVATRDIEGMKYRYQSGGNIFDFILDNLYPSGSFSSFEEHIATLCTKKGCPLTFMRDQK